MSGSHKEFPKKAVGIQLGLAALVGIGFLLADKPAVHAMADKVTKPIVSAAQKVLAPIGKVEVKAEGTGSASRSGEEVYASGCGTCHDNGVAGAPKVEDKSNWESRLSGGLTALITSAINGKGGMPARGGNPDNSDSEMHLAVSHMIKKAGIKLVAEGASTAAPTTTETTVEKTEEAPKAESKVEEVKEAVVEKTEEAVEKVMETVTEKTEEVVEKVEEVKKDAVAAVASAASTATATVDLAKGESIYKSSCFACHDSGVAGSPKIGDKGAWETRIAAGTDSMYAAAIGGKGAMPPKGGNTSISDDDIKSAVDYMIDQSK